MSFRKLLFPFSILYDGVTRTRNILYDIGIFETKKYDFPLICIGNLNVGGTGKSPMVEYVVKLFKNEYKVATLSRGYKRKSKGFHLLSGNETADMVGDEPLQFKIKFTHDIVVAVDEDRQHGIAEIVKTSNPQIIILDDAFQHRKVSAGFNILLTTFDNLYSHDLLLPAGNLREGKSGAKRAEAIIVTKCPPDLSENEMDKIKIKLDIEKHQKIYFTTIKYASKFRNFERERDWTDLPENTVLVTGIANPKPLINHVEKMQVNSELEYLNFPDHHIFSNQEIEKINSFDAILTTEKDYMRLKNKLPKEKLYYLPIEVAFLRDEDEFNSDLQWFVNEKMR